MRNCQVSEKRGHFSTENWPPPPPFVSSHPLFKGRVTIHVPPRTVTVSGGGPIRAFLGGDASSFGYTKNGSQGTKKGGGKVKGRKEVEMARKSSSPRMRPENAFE